MIIDKNNKFVFFHIPKNFGTAMTLWLDKNPRTIKLWSLPVYNKNPDMGHLNQNNYLRYLGSGLDVSGYYKFCVIRNPYERFIHCFNQTKKHSDLYNRYCREKRIKCDNHMCFLRYLKKHPGEIYNPNIVWISPQHIYTHKDGRRIVDLIIDYDDLESGINVLERRFKLHRRNFTVRKNNIYSHLFTKEYCLAVEEVYREDFSLLGFDKRSVKM